MGKISSTTEQHSAATYYTLVYEAQAALDLYHLAMRRWDLGSQTYPPLVITGYPQSLSTNEVAERFSSQPFIVAREG